MPGPNCLYRFQLAGIGFGCLTVAYMIVVTLLYLDFLVRIASFLLQAELAAQDLPGFLEEKLQPSQAP
jgi:hypothetical protein